ncbi:hypothetical protein ACIBQ6_21765 [Nonomuraea sp. NPDC049655]|uniref:hypothetical protein n=1 Tax=Nonomuraea sp. NPDC049655 TaxID=3364355 RepID=UPI0037A9FB42
MVASTELELDEAKRRASIGADGEEVPEQITHALRAPKGANPTVVVYHEGMTIKANLYSQGKRNPRREAAVWRCIRETAIRAREQLP